MWAYSRFTRAGGGLVARFAMGVVVAVLLGTALPAPALAAASAAAPPGTVTRTNQYLTDSSGRVLVPHGVLLPAGVTPTAADLDAWVRAGFSAAAVSVPLLSAGYFPDPQAGAAGLTTAATGDPGLTRAAQAVRALTDRGLLVVLRVVPAGTLLPTPAALAGAIGRLATAFRSTGGLVGYEITAQEAARAPGAASAVVAADPVHLLWRERPAPFDPTATVGVNDPAGYLTSWASTGDAAVTAFTVAADGNQIGWFYPSQADAAARDAGLTLDVPAGLARPYPIAVAGSPKGWGFTPDGTFGLLYTTTLPSGQATPAGLLTAVALPAAAFPTGYTVSVTGASVRSKPGSALLCLAADPGATSVTLRVTRAAAGSPPLPAPDAGAAACPAVAAATTQGTTAAGGPAATATHDAGASSASAQYSGPLLWALPLLGAAVMALLLVVPFRVLRRIGGGSDRSSARRPARDDSGGDAPRTATEAPAPTWATRARGATRAASASPRGRRRRRSVAPRPTATPVREPSTPPRSAPRPPARPAPAPRPRRYLARVTRATPSATPTTPATTRPGRRCVPRLSTTAGARRRPPPPTCREGAGAAGPNQSWIAP
jgi:hypothetical protein